MHASATWQPSFGDPTPLGWLTAALYVFVGVLCLLVAARTRRLAGGDNQAALFWLGIAAGLLALGLNKQLDLQTLLTQAAKQLSIQQGWYEQRRWVQAAFFVALAGALSWGIWNTQRVIRSDRYARLALLGAGYAGVFVLLRMLALAKVTVMLDLTVSMWGVRGFELAAPVVILWAAVLELRAGPPPAAREEDSSRGARAVRSAPAPSPGDSDDG